MGKVKDCPDFDSAEFIELLKEMPHPLTAEKDAFEIWVKNGGKYPDHILAKINTQTVAEEQYDEDTTRTILQKQKVIERAISLIEKKIGKLENRETKEAYIKKYAELLENLKSLEADAAIIEFIKMSEHIINSGLKSIEEIEKDFREKKVSLNYTEKALANTIEYIGVFEILKQIQKESINNPEFKELIPTLNNLIASQNDILLKTKILSRYIQVKKLEPYAEVVPEFHKRKAEKEFNSSTQAKSLRGEALKEARKEYINNYLNDNKGLITAEKRDFLNNILVNVEDVPYLVSTLSNPSDINNPILAYAVDLINKADFNTTKRVNKQAEVFDSLYKEYIAYMGNKSNMEDLYEPILEKDSQGNLTGMLVNMASSPVQYKALKEGKYKGTAVERLYDEVIRLQKEKDKMIPNGLRLGFKLPTMNKKLLERIYSENVLKTTGQSVVDFFKVNNTDTEFGDLDERKKAQKNNHTVEIITDEFGREKQNIPIHFRGKIDPKTQSYDVLGIMMLDLNSVKNYSEKLQVEIAISLLKENVGSADIIQRDWKGRLKTQKDGSIAPKKGIESNIYKNLHNLLQHNVYGISVDGNPQTIKILSAVKSLTSFAHLALNPFSAGANFTQGVTVEWVESIGGKTGAFGRINRINAYQKYTTDLPNMMMDATKNVPTSKSYLLAREFQIGKLFNPLDKKFIENNIAKKVGVGGTLNFMNNAGETHLQTILMYSVLDNIKVLDEKGNFLDKDFKPTKDRSKAIGLDSAYTVENGKLVLNKKVAKTERTEGVTSEDIRKLSKYYSKTSRELFGNGDSKTKSIAQRTIIGHMVFQMRSWLIPGFEKRFKGISKINTKSEDLTISQLEYNYDKEAFEEGLYTSGVRFLWSMTKDLKKLGIQAAPENWNKLTTEEKANVHRALAEATIIICALMLAMALKNAYDDDEEKDISLLVAAYFSRRLYSEMFTYANPKETLRTFKSPAILLSTAEQLTEVVIQTFNPTEEYTTGVRSGQNKLLRKTKKLVKLSELGDFDNSLVDKYNNMLR